MPHSTRRRIARALSLLSVYANRFREELESIDINPLICAGDRITAVDALIIPKGVTGGH